jgi:hypothetical protein
MARERREEKEEMTQLVFYIETCYTDVNVNRNEQR